MVGGRALSFHSKTRHSKLCSLLLSSTKVLMRGKKGFCLPVLQPLVCSVSLTTILIGSCRLYIEARSLNSIVNTVCLFLRSGTRTRSLSGTAPGQIVGLRSINRITAHSHEKQTRWSTAALPTLFESECRADLGAGSKTKSPR